MGQYNQIKAKYPDVTVYLRYADILRMLGELDEAAIQYKNMLSLTLQMLGEKWG